MWVTSNGMTGPSNLPFLMSSNSCLVTSYTVPEASGMITLNITVHLCRSHHESSMLSWSLIFECVVLDGSFRRLVGCIGILNCLSHEVCWCRFRIYRYRKLIKWNLGYGHKERLVPARDRWWQILQMLTRAFSGRGVRATRRLSQFFSRHSLTLAFKLTSLRCKSLVRLGRSCLTMIVVHSMTTYIFWSNQNIYFHYFLKKLFKY